MTSASPPHVDVPPPRAVIDRVLPEIDGGRHRVKRAIGDRFEVTAHVYVDGHDLVAANLLVRHAAEDIWRETPMEPLGNEEWRAAASLTDVGPHEYTVVAWVDRFGSWRADLAKRIAAGWEVAVDLLEGSRIVAEAAVRAGASPDAVSLRTAATWLADADLGAESRFEIASDPSLAELMHRHRDRQRDTQYRRTLGLWVDRERARSGAWYEMFPRSETPDPARGATLREAAARIPAIAAMGFDVLYLPPVHPIGETNRKGPGNRPGAVSGDPGSPWAIGSAAGGHTAVHPELGTVEDFDWFVHEAARHGLEVALDLAYQCSPDHPWVTEHPEWFRHWPDGSVRYAENPPKQYQDIYPIDFDTADWRDLWQALLDVVRFWIDHGVHIFRVDNPHTKPFPFWEWLIDQVHRETPDAIFLAEAFTSPKRMHGLAKLGFTQSYTYFTWRNEKWELESYFRELTAPPASDYFRPNLFANTPDILHAYLQEGGRAAFLVRLALAATLGPSYGIYSGYELLESEPAEPGSEEYLHSEKYERRPRDWDAPGNITAEVTRMNEARHRYPALQHNHDLWFLPIENDQMIAYVKGHPMGGGHVLTVVNLDPHATQTGWVGLPLQALGLPPDQPFTATEVLSGQRFTWQGEWNGVALNPDEQPAQVFVFTASPEDGGGGTQEEGAIYP